MFLGDEIIQYCACTKLQKIVISERIHRVRVIHKYRKPGLVALTISTAYLQDVKAQQYNKTGESFGIAIIFLICSIFVKICEGYRKNFD